MVFAKSVYHGSFFAEERAQKFFQAEVMHKGDLFCGREVAKKFFSSINFA